ncbi:hypothetical protein C8Q80DRAFT_1097662 [Daedaleopsis nitida]|nr:hypothetical protein C8Q80DRAFT_1097662 [Daedaleopsis nitida]
MIIRIMPDRPHPNILFTFNFRDPMHNDSKPCPASWHMQAQMVEALQDEGLGVESAQDVHAFDKAAWHSALLAEVAFDVVSRTVTCTFVDGSTVAWSLSSTDAGPQCLDQLDDVVAAVHGSAQQSERERCRKAGFHVQTSSYQADSVPGGQPVPASPVSSSPSKSHRRQKSLFSSIVAAFKGALSDNGNRGPTLPTSLPPLKIPSNSSHTRSSSTFSRTQRSPPDSPIVVDHPPAPAFKLHVRPRVPIPPPPGCKQRSPSERLRYYARSSLVDIVRRHVYPMFSTTDSPSFASVESAPEWMAQVYGFPPGLYPAWAARSLLRKTDERMREMIAEANAHGFGHSLGPAHSDRTIVALHEVEDEDDATSASTIVSATTASTETDGSSVHTPTDSPLRSPFAPGVVSPPTDSARPSPADAKMLPQVPRSPSPPSPTFDFDMSTYHALGMMRTRLLGVLSRMDSSPRQMMSHSQHGSDLTILEIKSRRRAWSNRDFVGGARLSLVGFATPFRSSPLARCEPVTAETVSRMLAQSSHEPERPALPANRLPELSAEFGVKTVTKEMDVRLFPVCEEDEEEDEPVGYQSGYGLDEYIDDEAWREMRDLDMESGLLAFPRPELPPSAADVQPHLYAHLHPMARARTKSMRKEHPPLPPPQLQRKEGALTPNSLLCQPLNVKVPVPVILDGSDVFCGDEERTGEFTLAMDLPPPPRRWRGEEVSIRSR